MFTNGSRYHWGPHRFLRHPTHGAVGSWALSSFCRSIFSVSLFKAKMAPFDRPLSSQRGRPFETEKDQGDSWGIENWDYSHIYIYTGLYLYHSYIIINYSICITYIITYIYMIWTDLRSPNLSHSLLFYQPVKSLRPSLETKANLTSPTGIRPQECHRYWWFMMPKYWFMMVNAGS